MPNSLCPICSKELLPADASIASRDGKIMILEGRVNCVVHPGEAAYTPFSDYCTIPLYLRKGRVHYLKFKTSQEIDRLGLQRNDKIRAEGCLHDVDGHPLVFAIRNCLLISRPEE